MGFCDDVVGHRRTKAILARALERGHLAHALLFWGPEGIGKRTLALELARALLCQDAPAHQGPCGACRACKKVRSQVHGDLLTLAPEKAQIKAVQVAEVLDEAALAPVEGRRRVLVVDDADTLNPTAANALLKLLEEPPGSLQIVLVTSRPHQLLPTINSRCQELECEPLNPAETRQVLEQAGRSGAELETLAELCGGAPGQALGEDHKFLRDLTEEGVRLLMAGEHVRDPISAAAKVLGMIEDGAQDLAQKRARLSTFIRSLARLLRDALIHQVGGEGPWLAPAWSDARQRLARASTAAGLRRAAEGLLELEADLMERNLHLTLSLEGLFIDLADQLPEQRR